MEKVWVILYKGKLTQYIGWPFSRRVFNSSWEQKFDKDISAFRNKDRAIEAAKKITEQTGKPCIVFEAVAHIKIPIEAVEIKE